tara:strand:- start:621 stop:929 length:309 start_codon:yes stop_codon:yes gene_type:complete
MKIIKFIIKFIFSIPPLDTLLPAVEKALEIYTAAADVGAALVDSAGAIFSGDDPFKAFSDKMKEEDECVSKEEIEEGYVGFLLALGGKTKTCDDITGDSSTN